MAYYYSVRGWLELSHEQLAAVGREIAEMRKRHRASTPYEHYLSGWCWSGVEVNWTRYVFYGADLNDDGVAFFEKTLNQLCKLNLSLSGYFHGQGEDGQRNFAIKVGDDETSREDSEVLVPPT